MQSRRSVRSFDRYKVRGDPGYSVAKSGTSRDTHHSCQDAVHAGSRAGQVILISQGENLISLSLHSDRQKYNNDIVNYQWHAVLLWRSKSSIRDDDLRARPDKGKEKMGNLFLNRWKMCHG